VEALFRKDSSGNTAQLGNWKSEECAVGDQ